MIHAHALPFLSLLLLWPALGAQEIDYQKMKTEAERLFAEASYAQAHELYLKADRLPLPAEEARWVDFRIADTLWRSQAGTRTPDPTRYERAQAQLEALLRDVQRVEDRDRVWAEVKESLGDFHWTRRDVRNWGAAWPSYYEALEWWAGSKQIDAARDRYLRMVWVMSSPPAREPYYYYGYYGNMVPLEVLQNALEIAIEENDRARAHYLVAMTLRYQGGDPFQLMRVGEEFEAALKPGKSTEWYDDALYHYAEWMASSGQPVPLENGQIRLEPDFVKAVALFRRLLAEHEKGETRYHDQARSQIQNITAPSLGIGVASFFLPDSEVEYQLSWRNLKRVDLALYKVDLTRDVDLAGENKASGNWVHAVELAGREKTRSWSKETGDRGDHRPGGESLRIEGKLAPGAYLLEARGEGVAARDLVLVSDAALVLKTSGKQALAYFCDALDGSPISGARVSLWERSHDGRIWRWRGGARETNQDGIAVFDLMASASNVDLFAAAISGQRQAFSTGQGHYRHPPGVDQWRLYAFTDRPAYRPGEKMEWKLIARTYDGSTYSTPARRAVKFQITDPRGTKAGEGTFTLNEFGSAWGSLELVESMPLGEYQVTFWDGGRAIGQAVLFRLEEYKLPEFKVSIETPEAEGRKKAFRLGDRVEVSIGADYYFGGAVADASVEVLVYQSPFYHWWEPAREYPWYFQDFSQSRMHWGGQGQVVKRETLKTDSRGKAVLTIDTPRGQQQDLEYRIEARVTDSSRREIVGSETVRVTRQRYHVYPRAEHNLYRPQDSVAVTFKALDANGNGVEVEGAVKVTRERWVEVWLAPDGKEVKGEDLKALQARKPVFPPREEPGWRLKFRGYEHEEVLSRKVKTDREGQGELKFTAGKEGYYRVAWRSEDRGAPPIVAETVLWVVSGASSDLGYRHGGVEIIVDRDTFRAGQKAPVMLSVETPGRHVLFSIEGDDLYSYRLVKVEGTVKLLEIDLEEKHVPNIFLTAAMVSDRQMHVDTEQVVVPPVRQFLTVEVKPDRAQYLPQEEAAFTVTALDHQGNPVAAEVALSLVDESVYYIQKDYAADPRQFFYGEKRGLQVGTHSTFEHKRFAKLGKKDGDRAAGLGWSESYDEMEELKRESDGSIGGRDSRRRDQQRGNFGMKGKEFRQAKLALADTANAPAARSELSALAEGPPAESGAGQAGGEPPVQVRSDFRSTVLWEPKVVTGEDGKATLKVKLPDSLTTFRATARAGTRESRFGTSSASIKSRLPLIVRLQAPRFFVAGDSVTVSAVINNNTERALSVTPALIADGLELKGYLKDGKPVAGAHEPLTVYPNSEARADWLVAALKPGSARLKATARADKLSDGMEKSYVVHEHGIEKLIARSGKMRGDAATVKLDLPRDRKAGSTSLVVQAAPSMAVTMLDALPYLADYPYGCTEQTMSRFLPAVITANTLKELKLTPEAVAGRIFGGIEPAHASKTHPRGKIDLRRLEEMAQKGLERIYDFQHADGGWGWWKPGESDHFMTAYVVWGLTLARGADLDVKPDAVERGASFLEKEIVEEEENPDLQAWMLHALAVHHSFQKRGEPANFAAKALENLWKRRDALNAYTRALLALSAHHLGQAEKARTLVRNLENGVKVDATPDVSVVLEGPQESQEGVVGNAHWGEDGIFWRWSEGGVEATAFALRALLAIDPGNKLVEPVTNWLVKNRRGAQWSNTRDTAIAVLTLNEYLKKSGELEPGIEYEVLLNGERVLSRKVAPAEALEAPSRFSLDPQRLRDERNEIRIVRKGGKSPLYFAVEARFFSQEEPVTAQGNEIFARRDYQKLTSRPTLLKGHLSERVLLPDQGRVVSGERVESIITIEAKNNYEYLVFEDLKPAGLEAVEIRSGTPLHARELKSGAVERKAAARRAPTPGKRGPAPAPLAAVEESDYTGRTCWVYQELRDRKVALFIDKLPEGVWEIRYELRAESPGSFHALPVLGHAMYAPEIRTNGAEARIEVEDSRPDVSQRVRRAVVGGSR